MIRVTVELLPHGDERRKRHLGTAEIVNNGHRTLRTEGERGGYSVRLSQWDPNRTWRTGEVPDFDRVKRGPWDLLYLALKNIVAGRNP